MSVSMDEVIKKVSEVGGAGADLLIKACRGEIKEKDLEGIDHNVLEEAHSVFKRVVDSLQGDGENGS